MIDLTSGTVRLPPSSNKTRQGRVLVLSEPLCQVIERRLQQREMRLALVFIDDQGRDIKQWRPVWEQATEAAGCPGVRFHDIRRTVVRNLIRAGVPEGMAMAMTGHKTRAVFDRYNITTARDVAQAAAQLAQCMGKYDPDTDTTRTGKPIDQDGPLAHQAEHLPFKQVVPGSSPGRLIPMQRPSGIHTSTHKRPHRLAWSRTSPFHGGNGGSNPPGDAWNFKGLRRGYPLSSAIILFPLVSGSTSCADSPYTARH
jgi:hypothetical protein